MGFENHPARDVVETLAERPAYRSLMPCGRCQTKRIQAANNSGFRFLTDTTLGLTGVRPRFWPMRFNLGVPGVGTVAEPTCNRAGTVTADPWFFGQWYVADLRSETKISELLRTPIQRIGYSIDPRSCPDHSQIDRLKIASGLKLKAVQITPLQSKLFVQHAANGNCVLRRMGVVIIIEVDPGSFNPGSFNPARPTPLVLASNSHADTSASDRAGGHRLHWPSE